MFQISWVFEFTALSPWLRLDVNYRYRVLPWIVTADRRHVNLKPRHSSRYQTLLSLGSNTHYYADRRPSPSQELIGFENILYNYSSI
jgi:hypothetical protein